MRAKEIMSRDPQCCTPDDTLQAAARMMGEFDCGCLPVVEESGQKRVVGVLTDRDIALRGVAQGRQPNAKVNEVMSTDPACCSPEDEIEVVERIMAEKQVRRVPVVASDGRVVGIIAQADMARNDRAASDREVGKLVEKISEPASTRTARSNQPEQRL